MMVVLTQRTLQLPLGLLNAAQGHPMLVELKNGETLNGHLIQCDTWMNLTLKEVIQTSPVCARMSAHLRARERERAPTRVDAPIREFWKQN